MKNPLDEISKQHPFKVPEGYFESLTDSIQSRMIERQKRSFYFIPLIKWALVPAFIFIIGFIYLIPTSNSPNPDLLAEVSNDAILIYLENSGLEEVEIASLLSPNEAFYNIDQLDILIEDENLDQFLEENNLSDEYL